MINQITKTTLCLGVTLLTVFSFAAENYSDYSDLPETYKAAVQEELKRFIPDLSISFAQVVQDVVRKTQVDLAPTTWLKDVLTEEEKEKIFAAHRPAAAPQIFQDNFDLNFGELLSLAGGAATIERILKNKNYSLLKNHIELLHYDDATQTALTYLPSLGWPYCSVEITVFSQKGTAQAAVELNCD